LHDPARIDLLFTMSENTQTRSRERHACEAMFRGRMVTGRWQPVFSSSELRRARFADPLSAAPREARRATRGGARRDRTDDLMLAKHALSQLSYGPVTRRRMLYVEVSRRSSVSPSSPHSALKTRVNALSGLRRARFAFLLRGCATRSFAWLRHAEPKAKRGGPGKT
jgi:hypothetical protein